MEADIEQISDHPEIQAMYEEFRRTRPAIIYIDMKRRTFLCGDCSLEGIESAFPNESLLKAHMRELHNRVEDRFLKLDV